LKKEFATLDVVVTGVEYGHGRRREVLSDYTFAVRDGESGALLTIGKAYSGLTDREIAELTPWFLARVRRVKGRWHEVEPELVIEVAFDSIRPSARHPSGLALRFPRIKGLRRDKTVAEIDTLQSARKMAAT
jgi:DNA ligase-1